MTEIENISPELFDRIEQYHTGAMSLREKAAFEREIQRDENLRAEVKRQLELMQSVEVGGLRAQLQDIHQTQEGTRIITIRRVFAAAACVVALLTGTLIYQFSPKSNDLFAEYATADPGLPTPMSATSNYTFYDAMVDYKNEKYSVALTKWMPLLETDPSNDTLLYYIASAHFNLADWPASKKYYDVVMADNASVFHDKAIWYSALIAYKLEDTSTLKQLLEVSGPLYQDKIRELHEALSKP